MPRQKRALKLNRNLAFFIVASCFSTQALAAPCASRAEVDALNMRILQTDLMVAGLSCPNVRNAYNQFVGKHRPHLLEHSKVLQGYVKRAGKEVNQYITELSNQSSNISLRLAESQYCQRAQLLFGEVYSMPHQNLLDALVQTPNIMGRHHIALCP